MRSHSAIRLLTMLLVALLVGAVAAPAEAKRPRRYEDIYLVNWEICPTGATLTIGAAGTPDGEPGPPPYTDDVLVDVDAELASNPGSTLVEGEPRANVRIPNVDDVPIQFFFLTDDEEVTDEDPANQVLQDGAITHRTHLSLVWSERVGAGVVIRLGFTSNSQHKWGRFRIDSCEPGVTTPGSPVSTKEILDFSEQIDENRAAGRRPGGSLVPLAQCTIMGTPGKDRIEGTRRNDVICGLGGDDVIDGSGGLDLIDGGDGHDRLSGGSRKDVLVGLRGNDRINGNSGDDRAGGGAGNDRLRGSSGNDRLSGGSGDDWLSGDKGHDLVRGGPGSDRISGRDRRRDTVDGGSGRDRATLDRLGGGAGPTGRPPQADRVRGVEQLL